MRIFIAKNTMLVQRTNRGEGKKSKGSYKIEVGLLTNTDPEPIEEVALVAFFGGFFVAYAKKTGLSRIIKGYLYFCTANCLIYIENSYELVRNSRKIPKIL